MNPAVMSAVKRGQRGPVLLKLSAGTDPRALGFTYIGGDSNSWYADVNGLYHNTPSARPRYDAYVRDNLGAWRKVLLLEPLRTNQLHASANFAATTTDWVASSDFTVTTAPSILSGQLAYKHTNNGAIGFRARVQTIGVLTGQAETASVIVENVNAVTTRFGIWDDTLGTMVIATDFDWATHTATLQSGAGTVRVLDQKNGRYRLIITGIGVAGHTRKIFIYITGVTQNTNAAIIHHAQHEEAAFATSPIVTPVGATVTRAAQYLTLPLSFPVEPISIYESFVELGTLISLSSNTAYMSFGRPGVVPALIRYNRTNQEGWAFYGTTITPGGNVPNPQPVIGDSVEVRSVFRRVGAQAEGRISMAKNGAAETIQNVVPIADAAFANASPWSAPGKFALNGNDGGGLIGCVGYSEVLITTGNHDMSYLRSL